MSQVTTCLIGAKVIVTPDAEVTEKGVDVKKVEGVIVAVYLMPPMAHAPQFQAPHFSVLVEGHIWPVVPTCRIEVIEVPALEAVMAMPA